MFIELYVCVIIQQVVTGDDDKATLIFLREKELCSFWAAGVVDQNDQTQNPCNKFWVYLSFKARNLGCRSVYINNFMILFYF